MQLSPELLALLRGIDRATGARQPSPASLRNPHRGQGRLSARPMVLSERTRQRGGLRSRRRVHRVWVPR